MGLQRHFGIVQLLRRGVELPLHPLHLGVGLGVAVIDLRGDVGFRVSVDDLGREVRVFQLEG